MEMWIQGLKIVVAAIIWMIVPMILMAIGFGFAGWSAVMGGGLGYPAMFGAWIVIGVIGVAIAFLLAIIMCMAIVHMIKHNRFGKAFAIGEILDIIKRIGWGKYIRWLIVIFVIALVISAIGNIPLIGWLISLIIGPLFTVFAARSASLIYSEAKPTPTTPPSEAKYCKNCGESLPPEAEFCPKCGRKME